MIDGEDEICLTPNKRYSKIQISILSQQFQHLKNWVERAEFGKFLKCWLQQLQQVKNKKNNLVF